MSIPLDRLYHYIESVAQDVYGDTIIYHFYPHGSKNINDLHCLKNITSANDLTFPEIICNDQEPLDYDFYADTPFNLGVGFRELHQELYNQPLDINQYPKKNIRYKSTNIYDQCILLHSEENSHEVIKYQENGEFIPVYYWSHSIIARDWFRYAEHITIKKNPIKDFLIYNRAWSGTRQYRIKFSDLLIDAGLLDHCKTNFNPEDHGVHYRDYHFDDAHWIPKHDLEQYLPPTYASSAYSADFDIEDYQTTNIEIVLETLFDDSRWHLTEKSLRPIACRQPFILAATPNSLEYLKSYGFQTYSEIFDESYDTITNPIERLNAIVKLMQTIANWSDEKKQSNLDRAQQIADYNYRHFFSNKFINSITTELKNNLTSALNELENSNTGRKFLSLRGYPAVTEYTIKHCMSRQELADLRKLARNYRDIRSKK